MNLPKIYEPDQYESDIYALWERSGGFQPTQTSPDNSFSVVLPPPNANGDLHIGHGLTIAVEDIAVRYHRMRGKSALFLPGADHAGFETQVVYERELEKAGQSRFDFSREQLYAQIWDFVAANKDNYMSQFRRLGASLDWTRFTYTLDDKIVNSAYRTFKKMWDEGLVYRGERLINYCTYHGTGFADIEVEFQDVEGSLWYISYPLIDGSGSITVATTRPETMLGDVAVAVHPNDPRYRDFIGKTVRLPLTQRQIPVIADEFVETEFGTGAVKITPAHDQNDYEVGQRHDLPMISVIDYEGKMSSQAPKTYQGLSTTQARQQVVADLTNTGALVKTEPHHHSVAHCYKCGTAIEPLLKEQWFINMQPLAARAVKALRQGQIKFYPDAKQEQLIRYLSNLRDWNISRQIAWGIPIPAFQNIDNPDDWIYDERVEQELIEKDGKTYRRDPDVFDTWFSSSSWPYATLNHPDGEDYKQFYPLSLMETGADILYPWVSRMLMFGLYSTDQVPFKTVYLHGLVLDENGQKMSKSRGNVVDPIEKINQYGSDAFRIGMIQGQSAGNNQPFSEARLVAGRNFCNKLWNIARFIEGKLDDSPKEVKKPKIESLADEWILSKLQQSTEVISSHLDNYRFSEAYEILHHLMWDDFADWYIEASKTHLNPAVLAHGLTTLLKLAHPFAPFVTETIWQTLSWTGDTPLIVSSWPQDKLAAQPDRVAAFESIRQLVSEVRYIKSTLNTRAGLTLYHNNDKILNEYADLVKSLARLAEIKSVSAGEGLQLTDTDIQCWLDIDRHTIRNFMSRAADKRSKKAQEIDQLESRLSNQAYLERAPKELVTETRQQLATAQQALAKFDEQIQRFGQK